jgi:uncharacterized protein YpmS
MLACNLPVSKSPASNAQPTLSNSDPGSSQPTESFTNTLDPNAPIVEMKVTEAELTSQLVDQVSKQPQPILENPKVYLQNGQISVAGQSKQGFLTVDVLVVMIPEISADGNVNVKVISAKVGPIDAPDAIKQTLSDTINEQLKTAFNPTDSTVRIHSIKIADGVMTITGTKVQ